VGRFLRNLFWFPCWAYLSIQLRLLQRRQERLWCENTKLRAKLRKEGP
jgi:hypothetical protein